LSSYLSRLITWKHAQRLRKEGYIVAQLHQHSCGYPNKRIGSIDVPGNIKTTDSYITTHSKESGVDMVFFTEHHVKGVPWHTKGTTPPNNILSIEAEVKIPNAGWVHLAILGIKDLKFSSYLQDIAEKNDVLMLLKECNNNGALVVACHPFSKPRPGKFNYASYFKFIIDNKLPVEINEKRSIIENLAILFIASKYSLPIVAGKDAHVPGFKGACVAAKTNDVQGLIREIMENRNYIVFNYAGLFNQSWMMAKYITGAIKSNPKIRCGPAYIEGSNILNKIIARLNLRFKLKPAKSANRLSYLKIMNFLKYFAIASAGVFAIIVSYFYFFYSYGLASPYRVIKTLINLPHRN